MSARPDDLRQVSCSGCGRVLRVPWQWATAPGRDRRRGTGDQRRIVCHDRHFGGCLDERRHVVWAGLEDDAWALISDRQLVAP